MKSIRGIGACVKVYNGEANLIPYTLNGIDYVCCPHFLRVGCECLLARRKIPNPKHGTAYIAADHLSFVRMPTWCPLDGSRPITSPVTRCRKCKGVGRLKYTGRGKNCKEIPMDERLEKWPYPKWHNCSKCGGTGIYVCYS